MIGTLHDRELNVQSTNNSTVLPWRDSSDNSSHTEKVIVFLDDASDHYVSSVRNLGVNTGDHLVVVHLLLYATALNPIEIRWRTIRKAIANTCSLPQVPSR